MKYSLIFTFSPTHSPFVTFPYLLSLKQSLVTLSVSAAAILSCVLQVKHSNFFRDQSSFYGCDIDIYERCTVSRNVKLTSIYEALFSKAMQTGNVADRNQTQVARLLVKRRNCCSTTHANVTMKGSISLVHCSGYVTALTTFRIKVILCHVLWPISVSS